MPVQILDGAIVWENPELARGKEHCQEPVVFLSSVVIWIRRPALFSDPHSAGGAMMSICYISKGNLCKLLHQAISLIDTPDGMLDAIRSENVIERRGATGPIRSQSVQLGIIAIGEKYRAGVRAEGIDETR